VACAFLGSSGQVVTRRVDPPAAEGAPEALNSLGGIAAIVAPIVGTTLLARFGEETSSPHIPGAAFLAASAFNVLALLLAVRL
jgi:hypothetical protein